MDCAFILSLPNELLELIFTYTLILECYEFCFESHGPLQSLDPNDDDNIHQLFIIAQVCRKFRDVATRITIWYDHKFEAADFLDQNGDQITGLTDSTRLAFTPYDEENTYLPQRLQCILRTNSMLLDIMESRSPLDQPIHSVTVYAGNGNNPGIETSLPNRFIKKDNILLCNDITTLRVQCVAGINLNAVSILFPSLQRLYIGAFCITWGSLEQLSHLQHLEIDNRGDPDPIGTSVFFPMNSTNSLTRLTFLYGLHDGFDFDIHPIRNFTSLQHLHIQPLTGHICDCISNSNFRLITFKTQLDWKNSSVEITTMTDLLLSPCFKTLESLTLHLYYWDAFPHYYPFEDFTPVIDAITTNLSPLQYLGLTLPCDPTWCPKFTNLTDLDTIEWIVEQSRLHRPCTAQEILEGFRLAYPEFTEMPSITLSGALIPEGERESFCFYDDDLSDEDEDENYIYEESDMVFDQDEDKNDVYDESDVEFDMYEENNNERK